MAQQLRLGRAHTAVFTKNRVTNVVYHQTAVVKFSENVIVLDTGGYRTATTKTRMNQASNQFDLGFNVYQKGFEWFVEMNGNVHKLGCNPKLGDRIALCRNTGEDLGFPVAFI
jgi:hypothetical protein